MMVLNMLVMNMVRLLSVILLCIQCCHLKYNKCPHVTISCVNVNVAFLLKVYIHNCYPGVIGIWKKINDKLHNYQNRRSGDKSHHIYETYKNIVMPHGSHIYAKASDTTNATMCTYPQYDNTLPHYKCVLRCYSESQCIILPDQETN